MFPGISKTRVKTTEPFHPSNEETKSREIYKYYTNNVTHLLNNY